MLSHRGGCCPHLGKDWGGGRSQGKEERSQGLCGASLVRQGLQEGTSAPGVLTRRHGLICSHNTRFIIPILQMRKTEAQRSQLLRGSRRRGGAGLRAGGSAFATCVSSGTSREVSELTCKRSAFEYFSCVFPAVSWKLVIRSFRYICWRRKWQPTPVFLPGESQGQGSLVGCRL